MFVSIFLLLLIIDALSKIRNFVNIIDKKKPAILRAELLLIVIANYTFSKTFSSFLEPVQQITSLPSL